ncbi:uncharacterized protein STEHIDRAFT_126408 [Stereum hirsutum FP-91666 SS1]|uniref:Uncharacterized protein n=1 Tax=Stereum hirsutum (strain FP-91666) TaxID=721885 RepID=R7RWJ0_STEHR|nr:uncharacterized protein STEHIDRAFT_126408 [Stereum hirsutum FP-91666 SS1]EIM79736.1 hypothetical protein STEHIDRAFT_126408 [Stereum hirsutum FP-91666 SS1]
MDADADVTVSTTTTESTIGPFPSSLDPMGAVNGSTTNTNDDAHSLPNPSTTNVNPHTNITHAVEKKLKEMVSRAEAKDAAEGAKRTRTPLDQIMVKAGKRVAPAPVPAAVPASATPAPVRPSSDSNPVDGVENTKQKHDQEQGEKEKEQAKKTTTKKPVKIGFVPLLSGIQSRKQGGGAVRPNGAASSVPVADTNAKGDQEGKEEISPRSSQVQAREPPSQAPASAPAPSQSQSQPQSQPLSQQLPPSSPPNPPSSLPAPAPAPSSSFSNTSQPAPKASQSAPNPTPNPTLNRSPNNAHVRKYGEAYLALAETQDDLLDPNEWGDADADGDVTMDDIHAGAPVDKGKQGVSTVQEVSQEQSQSQRTSLRPSQSQSQSQEGHGQTSSSHGADEMEMERYIDYDGNTASVPVQRAEEGQADGTGSAIPEFFERSFGVEPEGESGYDGQEVIYYKVPLNDPSTSQPHPRRLAQSQHSASGPDSHTQTQSTAPSSQDPQDLANAVKILQDKSEEIAMLQRLLEEQRVKIAETERREEEMRMKSGEAERREEELRRKEAEIAKRIEAEVQTLPTPPPPPPVTDPRVAEMEGVLEKERTDWAVEREKLKQRVSMLETSKSSLLSDSDFLREEYHKASGAAASLRSENMDLEARAILAESQVTNGLALVRGTFEVRVKKLEEELGRANALNGILIEKERRTTDEIRWKASTFDEIERDNGILIKKDELLEAEIDELKEEMESVQRENERLREKLDRYSQRERAKQLMQMQPHAGMSDKTKGKQKEAQMQEEEEDESDVFDDDYVPGKDSASSGGTSTGDTNETGSGSEEVPEMRGSQTGSARSKRSAASDGDQRGDGGGAASGDSQQQQLLAKS